MCPGRVSVPWKDGPARTLEITSETAVWYRWGRPPVHIRWVLIRDPLCQMRTQALVCTDTEADPLQIVQWFLLRWRIEVTFQEVRAHLGVETQRQWSDKAISRTTPLLLGLFSWVTSPPGCCGTNARLPCVRAPGTPSVNPPSSMRSRWCAGMWFASQTLSTSPSESDVAKSLCLYSIVLWIPLPTQPERLYICLLRLL